MEYLGFVFTDLDARVAEVLLEGLNLITTHPVTQSAVPVSIARSVPIERQRAHTTRAQSLYIESTVSRLQELPPLSTVPAELLVPQLPDVYIVGERVCIYIFETSDWVSAQATVIRTRICSDYQNIHLRRTASDTVIFRRQGTPRIDHPEDTITASADIARLSEMIRRSRAMPDLSDESLPLLIAGDNDDEPRDQDRSHVHATCTSPLSLYSFSELEKRYIMTGLYEQDLDSSTPYTIMNRPFVTDRIQPGHPVMFYVNDVALYGTAVDISTNENGLKQLRIRSKNGTLYTRRINAPPPAGFTTADPRVRYSHAAQLTSPRVIIEELPPTRVRVTRVISEGNKSTVISGNNFLRPESSPTPPPPPARVEKSPQQTTPIIRLADPSFLLPGYKTPGELLPGYKIPREQQFIRLSDPSFADPSFLLAGYKTPGEQQSRSSTTHTQEMGQMMCESGPAIKDAAVAQLQEEESDQVVTHAHAMTHAELHKEREEYKYIHLASGQRFTLEEQNGTGEGIFQYASNHLCVTDKWTSIDGETCQEMSRMFDHKDPVITIVPANSLSKAEASNAEKIYASLHEPGHPADSVSQIRPRMTYGTVDGRITDINTPAPTYTGSASAVRFFLGLRRYR